MGYTRSLAYPWALTGIFAAVHLVITLIPFTIAIGGSGEISFGLVSAPMVGFLVGPFFGVLAVIIGSLIAMFINPSIAILGLFTVIATAAGAFAAGAMRTKIRVAIPLLFLVSMGMFLISPIGPIIPEFILFHFIIFLLSLLFIVPGIGTKLIEPLRLDRNFNRASGLVSLWLLSIVAVALDNVVGSAIGVYYFSIAFGMDPTTLAGLFALGIPVIPLERLFGSIVVGAILVGLAEALARTNFGLPLSRIGKYELFELGEDEI
ncbi:hypothetical protein EU528_05230 [Candidatus Thorarchaeota archaeon]|nr:MAG: hypothetical protein EU528_05230 [Candidatus Thorarchaeota archaeon]